MEIKEGNQDLFEGQDGNEGQQVETENNDGGEQEENNVDETTNKKPPVETEDDTEVDEKNVPLKNRIAEERRKREALEKRLAEIESRQQFTNVQQKTKVSDEEFQKEAEKLGVDVETIRHMHLTAETKAKQEVELERRADADVEAYLESRAETMPIINKVMKDVKRRLSGLPALERSNPKLMDFCIEAAVGKYHIDNPTRNTGSSNTAQQQKKGTLPPTNGGNNIGSVRLTDEERQFAVEQGFFERDFDEARIKSLYEHYKKLKGGK